MEVVKVRRVVRFELMPSDDDVFNGEIIEKLFISRCIFITDVQIRQNLVYVFARIIGSLGRNFALLFIH